MLLASCTNEQERLYQRGGEWETQLEILEMDFPGADAETRALLADMKTQMEQPERGCMPDRTAAEYPKPGKRFAAISGGYCTYSAVEPFGSPVNRSATCSTDEQITDGSYIMTGSISPDSYDIVGTLIATDQKMGKIKIRETGRRLGPCESGS